MIIHVFNPDTEYALAANRRYFTPPCNVLSLRRHMALLPACYAQEDDAILIMDNMSRDELEGLHYFSLVQQKGIRIVTAYEIKANPDLFSGYQANPWGWNKSIRQFLIDCGFNDKSLPDEKFISKLRELSHRRTTIDFHKMLSPYISDEVIAPLEVHDVDTAMDLYRKYKALYFKAPWSSSGRGILLSDDLDEYHVEPWIRGIIRRQGSVMAEKAYKRRLDFATEWRISDGRAYFLGFSVFNVSRRGKYHSNVNARQDELERMISQCSKEWSSEFLIRLKETVEQIIAPHYSGPLGIDMLITETGVVNPCVELNLRHTMGMLELL